MVEAVISLEDESCQIPAVAGNKAAVLSCLIRKGFPVPAGVCVTTDGTEGPNALWESALSEAVTPMSPPWIARSSSTAEDAVRSSLAGAFVSVAGISNFHALVDAVLEVCESLRSDTARQRAAAQDLDITKAKMAVLIQSLVPATVSGVAFGRHPVSGAPVVVIEANYGLPQTVVDGSVIPDLFEVPEEGPIVTAIGTKRTKVAPTPGGVERFPTTPSEQTTFTLAEESARELAELVRRLGAVLEAPQDVEWAATKEGFVILQARPITVGPDSGERA
jgi:phosphoenolpyruvate synthase/pyruvate phosphate dikinase